MHGRIGDARRGAYSGGDLAFYYRTRATLMKAQRRLGGDAIDYDFYRMSARSERRRVRREVFLALLPYARPLIAIAVLVASIFMVPKHGADCPGCDARTYKSMNSNHYLNH